MKESYIYILSNKNRTVFYTGITGDLSKRMEFHLDERGICLQSNCAVIPSIARNLFALSIITSGGYELS
jgi:hypothetical protein